MHYIILIYKYKCISINPNVPVMRNAYAYALCFVLCALSLTIISNHALYNIYISIYPNPNPNPNPNPEVFVLSAKLSSISTSICTCNASTRKEEGKRQDKTR